MQTLQTTSLRVSENQLLFSTSRPCRRKNAGWRRITLRCWWTIFITLRVRGAPLIGLSASLLLALLAQRGLNRMHSSRRWRRCGGAADGGQPDE